MICVKNRIFDSATYTGNINEPSPTEFDSKKVNNNGADSTLINFKNKEEKKENFRQIVISGKEFERIVYSEDRHYHFNPQRHTLTSLDGIKSWTSVLFSLWSIWTVIIIHTIILSNVFTTKYSYYFHYRPKVFITYIILSVITILHGIFLFFQV